MPRIPQELLDCSFYLYPSSEEAKSGGQAGGTGLIVGFPIPEMSERSILYAVSNSHVVHSDGCSVIRLNTIAGGTDVIEKDPSEWHAKPGDDLAVTVIAINPAIHKIRNISFEWFVKKQDLQDGAVAVGDDVFMVGRFMNHDGLLTNVPSVRFGHLSMPPLAIRHPSGNQQISFAVEMLSRPGYSGSPVYVYRVPYDLSAGNNITIRATSMKLLGINWGFITDSAEVNEKTMTTAMVEDEKAKTVKYVRVNTGMNGVVPAWHLEKLLNYGPVKRERNAIIAQAIAAAALIPPDGVA
jgi:hypothetical protein